MTRQLSQQEIDAVFQNIQGRQAERAGSKRAALFDFRRPDRIAKSQLRAIHQLHDNFVRNLVSSLSAYLRSYLIVNLVSVEQLSYSEFLECLPSPTCIASLSLKPYDGNAVLELNSSLIFPILEIQASDVRTVPPWEFIEKIDDVLVSTQLDIASQQPFGAAEFAEQCR